MRRRAFTYALLFACLTTLGAILLGASSPLRVAADLWNYHFVDYRAALKDLEKKYGVAIIHEVGPHFILELWREPPSNGRATPISDFELSRYARILRLALDKYPSDVITRNLGSIRLSSSLSFYGVAYGGTSLGNVLYLTSAGRTHGFDDRYIEQVFHHEFSSVLLRNYAFPQQRWLAANPVGFEYPSGDDKALQSISAQRSAPEGAKLYSQGFLSEYGRSTLENDMNLYAETIFTDAGRMKKLVATYARVRTKYLVLKDFYLGISPEFAGVFAAIL
jgi:hypothetical protein